MTLKEMLNGKVQITKTNTKARTYICFFKKNAVHYIGKSWYQGYILKHKWFTNLQTRKHIEEGKFHDIKDLCYFKMSF